MMENYAKVNLQFKTCLWGDNKIIVTAVEPRVYDTFPWVIISDLPKYFRGSKILSFHVGHQNSRLVDSQDIQLTVNDVVVVLSEAYGEETVSRIVSFFLQNCVLLCHFTKATVIIHWDALKNSTII